MYIEDRMKVYKFLTSPIQVNTYLAFDETNVGIIVDPGGFDKEIVRFINEKNINIKYIVLTHGHGDHVGGIAAFKDAFPQIKVIAFRDEKQLLNDAGLNASKDIFGYDISLDADIYVNDGDKFIAGNTEFEIIHTPGHTLGGMCIYQGEYMFTGDTIFRESIGRTDFYGGNYSQIINSIKNRIFKYPDNTILLPGHMGDTTIAHEKRYNPFVQD